MTAPADGRVYVEAESEQALRAALSGLLAPGAATAWEALGVRVSLVRVREAIQYADDFMRQQGLVEEPNFYERFDMSKVTFMLDFSATRDELKTLVAVACDLFGRTLSGRLQGRTIVAFEGGEMPYRVYQGGRPIADRQAECRPFLDALDWVPSRRQGGDSGSSVPAP